MSDVSDNRLAKTLNCGICGAGTVETTGVYTPRPAEHMTIDADIREALVWKQRFEDTLDAYNVELKRAEELERLLGRLYDAVESRPAFRGQFPERALFEAVEAALAGQEPAQDVHICGVHEAEHTDFCLPNTEGRDG